MTHFYERNIVEIKTLYTSFLINILTPLIYEGIKSVYNNALTVENKFIEKGKVDPHIENPGILKIFQLCLKDIPTLNQHEIENETSRIKEKSKCSDWFDDLIKAVVKSHIILLTYNASGKTCKTVKDKHHEGIKTSNFIHKCYIECARNFYNYPEIFYHKYSTLDIKRNQREAQDIIKTSINEAIKKMLPIKLILQEYLSNDYLREIEDNIANHMTENQYTNMSNLVKRDLNQNIEEGNIVNVFDDGTKHSTIVETTDDLESNDINQNNFDINNMSNENKIIDESNNDLNESDNVILDNSDNKTSDIETHEKIIYVNKPIKEKGGNNFFNNLTVQPTNNLKMNNDLTVQPTNNLKMNNDLTVQPSNNLKMNNDLTVQPSNNLKMDNDLKYSNKINANESDDMNINIVRSIKDSNYSALFDDYMN